MVQEYSLVKTLSGLGTWVELLQKGRLLGVAVYVRSYWEVF